MRSFGELLVFFTARAGISDSELARAIGVQRQTIFRWKEGHTSRPRYREDVLRMAEKLRLSPAERDELLLAAGFPPQETQTVLPPPAAAAPVAVHPATADTATAATATADTATADTATADTATADTAIADMAATPAQPARPQRPRPPRLFANPGILLAAAAAIMLAVALGGYFALPLIFGPRAAVIPTAVTPTAVPVTIAAPPAAPTPPVPTPTPIAAAAGEKLLLVAPFVGYTSEELRYNVAGRIDEALQREIRESQLANVRVVVLPNAVSAQVQARTLLSDTGALALIWGEYDAGRVRATVTTPDDGETAWVNPVDSPAKLSLAINENVPNAARMLALLSLGRVYRDEQDLPTALRIFQKALALGPQDPTTGASLHFYAGLLLPKVQGITVASLTAAIDHFGAALALQPTWENLQYNRGTSYLGRALLSLDEHADLDAAIADLDAVVQKQPQRVDPLLNLGIALYQRHKGDDLAAALAAFDRVIALAPDDARGYYHRGLARIRAGGAAGWSDDLLAARARAPHNAQQNAADHALCWGYALAGEAQAALPYCDAAIAAAASDTASGAAWGSTSSSFDGRAIAYSDLRRYADAAADLKQYLVWVQAAHPELYAKYHGPEAEGWLAALARGENPFTPEVRDALR